MEKANLLPKVVRDLRQNRANDQVQNKFPRQYPHLDLNQIQAQEMGVLVMVQVGAWDWE